MMKFPIPEKNMSKKKRRFNREDRASVQKFVKKAIAVARAGIEIYFAAKRKDPIFLGLSLMSSYEALENILTKEGDTLHQRLLDNGLVQIVPGMEKLVYETLNELKVPSEYKMLEKTAFDEYSTIHFKVYEVDVYIAMEGGNYIRGIYAKSEEAFIEAFGRLLKEKLGDKVAINVYAENYNSVIKLSSIDIPLNTYICPVDEKEYCETIRKFGKMNLNRSSLLYGPPGSGKAQPLDALVLTPDGFVEMKDINVGSEVLTPSGETSKVIGTFPQGEKDIYRIYFSDGTSTECCKEHLWLTSISKDRRWGRDKSKKSVKSLEEIKCSLRVEKDNRLNHAIPMVNKIDFNSKELPLDPYILGVLLGDGCFRHTSPVISSSDDFIINTLRQGLGEIGCNVNHFCKYDYRIINNKNSSKNKTHRNELYKIIRDLGLFHKGSGDKFVPEIYKFSTFENRLEILRGLMDTDGYVSKSAFVMEFCSASEILANDVKFLVESLGGRAIITNSSMKYKYKGKMIQAKNRNRVAINLPPSIIPFKLERKLSIFEKVKENAKFLPRYIVDVEYIGKKEAKCILIDHPEHLYITNNFIVTHNTSFSAKVADMLGGRLVVVDSQALQQAQNQGWNLVLQKILHLLSPTVILFDDIDRLENTGILLGMIENLNKFKNREIIIMASINDLTQLPEAMRRPGRFDEIMLFEKPDFERRKQILKTYLDFFGTRLADMYVEEMATLTEDLTPAYLREVALQATVASYDRIPKVIEHMKKMIGIECSREEDWGEMNEVGGSFAQGIPADKVFSEIKRKLGI